MSELSARFGRGFLIAVWLGAVTTGFAFWEEYDATPGDIPATAGCPTSIGDPYTIVLYVHPHCPCSRAGVRALDELIREPGSAGWSVRIVFLLPPGMVEEWARGPLWDAAAAVPTATLSCEPAEQSARTANAVVSGHTVVFDGSGSVAFVGGLTPGRGRNGDSPGLAAVRAILHGSDPAVRSAPVFGCPLSDPAPCQFPSGVAPCPR